MAELTYPGVYTQEAAAGPGVVQSVSTSNLGLVGFTKRGPVNQATFCSSFADTVSKFGGFTSSGLAMTEAYSFFANGGTQLYMVRTVHSDAVAASADWTVDITGEILTTTAQPTGTYHLDTVRVPIVASVAKPVRITFVSAGTQNIFVDTGSGIFAVDPVSTGSGGTGSIDHDTGEISIQLTAPTDFVGGADAVLINYTYKVATFQMQWPGEEGDLFRVRIQGSPDYYNSLTASYTGFQIFIDENTTPTTTATWTTQEQYDGIVFNDVNDSNYFKTVLNDPLSGSDLVEVVDYGNAQNPALAGTLISNEDFSGAQVPAYDGTTKQFVYTMANPVSPNTFSAVFRFIERNWRIGTGDGTATPTCTSLGAPIIAGGGTVPAARVTVALTLTVGGATTLYDDGAGNLRTSPFPGTVHGTVAYTTGAVTLNIIGTTTVAGTPITISVVYRDNVTVADDGNGNISVQAPAVGISPPTKFQLNSNGTNSLVYSTGVMTLTWKVIGMPSAGPAGVGFSPTAAFKIGAVQPYALTPGANFSLDVDNVGPATVTFDAAAGYITDTTAYPCADQDGLTLILSIDGASQTVLFAGATTTAASIINQINAGVSGAYATDVGGQVRIISDSKGTGSSIVVTGGTHGLTFGAPVAGTGDVVDITAVTAAEVETRIEADTTANVTVNLDGTFTIFSPTTGATSELDFISALAALGLSIETIVGTSGTATSGELATYYTYPATEIIYSLTGGADGSATDRNDVTAAALEITNGGIYALRAPDQVMQVVIADFQTNATIARDVITFCENQGDKFGLLTVPEGLSAQEAVNWRKFTLAQYSNKVALYYPHVRIVDPVTGKTINTPCGGHVAGIYARTDYNKNVAKAPAGVQDGALRFVEGLEANLSDPEIGLCTQSGINALSSKTQTGLCVWGARTLEIAGGLFPYIQNRRLFQFVQKSIYNSTHVYVFDNNNPTTWNNIRLQVESFLYGLFKANYFPGATPAECYRVICDATNNNVNSSQIYCEVGLALNKPSEFVVFIYSPLTV